MTSKEFAMSAFNDSDVQILGKQQSYRGFFSLMTLKIKHRLFAGGWSPEIKRELFCRGSAAAAILYDPAQDTIGMIEQFRVGALGSEPGPWCYEVVAGIIDAGETPEATIKRELIEEAAFEPVELLPICRYLSSPGGSDEQIHLYCAVGNLQGKAGLHGLDDEAEDIRLHLFPAAEILADIFAPKNCNAATLIALQWLALNKSTLT